MAIDTIKRKSGTKYRATFCKNRNRFSKCFDRKIDAILWLQGQEKLHHFGYKPNLSFVEASNHWLQFHSQVRKAPTSYGQDQRFVKEFVEFFPNLNLDQITPEWIERYIAARLKTGVKAPTVNRSLQCLRAILNYFIRKQHLLVNAVAIVGLLPEPEAAYDYLSQDEAYTFLSYANQKYQGDRRWVYCLYVLAINGGMRWGEIAGLQWDRVDFHNKAIIVSRTYCKQTGKVRETTKSRKVRYVGMNSSVLPEIKYLYDHRNRALGFVFLNKDKLIDLSNFKRDYFEKDLRESGLRKIRFHDLRHTFASHFAMNGGNLYDLQKLLGHSGIKITERYAHLSPNSVMSKTELVAIDGKLADVIPIQREAH